MKKPLNPARRIWHVVDFDGWPYPGGPYTTRKAAVHGMLGELDYGDRVVSYELVSPRAKEKA